MTVETDRIAELEAQLAQSIPKAEVVRVSRKYANAHGWCNVVDQALREVGALTPPVVVTTTLTVTQNVRLTIDADVWNALDEEGQKAQIASLARRGGLYIYGSITSDDGVTRLETVGNRPSGYEAGAPGAATAAGQVPAGYTWLYLTNTGRVRHLWLTSVAEGERMRGQSVCGRSEKARYQALVADSLRGEDRNCQRCTDRAANLS